MNKQKKKLPLAMQIFIALILAIVVGLLIQSHATLRKYVKPFGTIFLNLLKFIVVPIVLFSIMCGIISMRGYQKSRSNRSENGCILYVYDSICHYDRSDWR